MSLQKCISENGRHSWDWTNRERPCYICFMTKKELGPSQDHLLGERVLAHEKGKEATIVEVLNPGWVRILYVDGSLAIYPYRKLIKLLSPTAARLYEELFL